MFRSFIYLLFTFLILFIYLLIFVYLIDFIQPRRQVLEFSQTHFAFFNQEDKIYNFLKHISLNF